MSMVVLKMFMAGGTSILVYYSYATCVSQWLQMSYNAGAVHLILTFPLCLQSTSTNAILIRFRCENIIFKKLRGQLPDKSLTRIGRLCFHLRQLNWIQKKHVWVEFVFR